MLFIHNITYPLYGPTVRHISRNRVTCENVFSAWKSKIAGSLHSAMLVIERMYTECGNLFSDFLDSLEPAVIIMITVFWDMTPCSLIKCLPMFRKKAATPTWRRRHWGTSETLIHIKLYAFRSQKFVALTCSMLLNRLFYILVYQNTM
jgi:hypothetical protein